MKGGELEVFNKLQKMLNKKGISDIIATVLIVLLALAAVAIIWSFVSPMIARATNQASCQAKCIEVEVLPTECITWKSNASDPNSPYYSNVTIKRTKGEPYELNLILELTDGNTMSRPIVTGSNEIPSLQGTKLISNINLGSANAYSKRAIVQVFVQDDEGKRCPACTAPQTITCTQRT